jgi:tetratricopeptide (TPR) repeat protein
MIMKMEETFAEGQYAFVSGKYEEAIDRFSEALESNKDEPILYLSRGVAYVRMKELEKAIRDFTRTIELDDNNVRAYYYRGIAHMARDKYAPALSDLNKVLSMKPGHGAAHLARGTIYALLGEDEKSVLDMKTAIIQSEAQIQGFADTFGIFRTQFHKAMAHAAGEREHDPSLILSEEEIETVKKWMEAS